MKIMEHTIIDSPGINPGATSHGDAALSHTAQNCRVYGVELKVFQQSLGSDVTVERTQHFIYDDSRCVYRIQER